MTAIQRTISAIAMAQGLDPSAAAAVPLSARDQQVALEIEQLSRNAGAQGGQGSAPQLSAEQQQLIQRITTEVRKSGSMPTWLKLLLSGVEQRDGNYAARPINRAITDPLQEALTANIVNKTEEVERVREETRQIDAQISAAVGNSASARPIPADGLPMPDPQRRSTRSALIEQLEKGGGRETVGGGALYGYLVYLNNWEAKSVRYTEELKQLNARMGHELNWQQRAELQNRLQILKQQIDLHAAEEQAAAAETGAALHDELTRERMKNLRLREENLRTRALGANRGEY